MPHRRSYGQLQDHSFDRRSLSLVSADWRVWRLRQIRASLVGAQTLRDPHGARKALRASRSDQCGCRLGQFRRGRRRTRDGSQVHPSEARHASLRSWNPRGKRDGSVPPSADTQSAGVLKLRLHRETVQGRSQRGERSGCLRVRGFPLPTTAVFRRPASTRERSCPSPACCAQPPLPRGRRRCS